jgi:hypothetical protein
VRLVGEGRYRADSWERERRVVFKTQILPKGPNVRFVLTSRTADAPLALYDCGTSIAARRRAGLKT